MTRPEITGVPGVPETLLSDALLARLPQNLAPAPWEARCQAVIWMARGGKAATAALPGGLRSEARGLAVIGGLVRYFDTPVGTYDEVFGIVGAMSGRKPWGCVTFMAVDSEASLVGGRSNWAMPKTLAIFEGGIGSGQTMTATGADDVKWRVSATPRAIGVTVPYRTKGDAKQEFPDGSVRYCAMQGRFKMQPALVTVQVESDSTLPEWLRPGRHPGAVSEEMTFSLGAPRPT